MTPSSLFAALLLTLQPQEPLPGDDWLRYRDPSQAGWSAAGLEAARAYWDSIDSAAWMVVEDGIVVVAWGDVERRYMCHSVRKSLLSGLYGIHVDSGLIDTELTMAELSIDDEPPLTATEKKARIEDLLRARSGVYKLAAYEPPQNPKPPRGSHDPGTHWVYNNWDFNTLVTIFEQLTEKKVFEDFALHLAGPLDMQDFRVRDGYYHFEHDKSIHPAYPFRMSARDCARFGLLYLRRGDWGGERILSEAWIDRCRKSYSDTGSGGYGYMWWIPSDDRVADTGLYTARGVGGQTIAVLPQRNLVIVNRTNTYLGKNVTTEQRMALIELILKAQADGERQPYSEVELVPLASDASAQERLSDERLQELSGTYEIEGRGDVTVRAEDGVLLLDTPFAGVFGLHPVEGDVFLCEDVEMSVVFVQPARGERGEVEWEWLHLRRWAGLHEGGQLDMAIEVAAQALDLFPNSALAHFALASSMASAGDTDLAQDLCRAALELDPEHRDASRLLDSLVKR